MFRANLLMEMTRGCPATMTYFLTSPFSCCFGVVFGVVIEQCVIKNKQLFNFYCLLCCKTYVFSFANSVL